MPEIYNGVKSFLKKFPADVVAVESLIYVKSPTALIKLAQARGVMLAALIDCGFEGKIFEYSPNLVKSQTTGHGHSDKLAGQKFLDTVLGKRHYATDDESDALLVAMCHGFYQNKGIQPKKNKGRGLASSVAHRI